MIKSYAPYLSYILDIIKDIEDSIKDIAKNDFNKDKKEANIRRIEIVGNAVKNISEEFKNKHQNINWKKFENIGYVFANHYFGVDINIIWDIVKIDIPKLKQEIEEIINKEKHT